MGANPKLPKNHNLPTDLKNPKTLREQIINKNDDIINKKMKVWALSPYFVCLLNSYRKNIAN